MKKQRQIAGWREFISLPEWGIPRLRAKLDTGARTSSLHVENLVPLGKDRVSFEVELGRRAGESRAPVVADVVRISRVKPSSGTTEVRFVVRTTMVLAGVEQTIEVSLSNRSEMLTPMLIGRKALKDHFLVDSRRTYRLTRRRSKDRQ